MKRPVMIGAVIVIVLLLLALTGCEEYQQYETAVPQSPAELTAVVTIFADAPEPLQQTAQAIALERYATRSAVEVGAAEAAAQATAQAAIYGATQVAMEVQAEQERLWATQQAANATQVAQATAQAFSMQLTADAVAIQATMEERAYQATATAEALSQQATATAEARNWEATQQAAMMTRQVEATGTALALEATATRAAWEDRTTATAESHQATASVAQATMTRQAEKREAVLGYGRDYGIPLVLLVIAGSIGTLVVYGLRQYSQRPIVYPRNFLGDAEPMAVPVHGGGFTFVDLDRQPGPALTALPDGTVHAPQLRSAGQEERTTARDQLADMATRPRMGGGQKAGNMPALPLAPPPTPPAPGLRSVQMLRRLDQAAKGGLIPGPLLASLAADWETEPGEEL